MLTLQTIEKFEGNNFRLFQVKRKLKKMKIAPFKQRRRLRVAKQIFVLIRPGIIYFIFPNGTQRYCQFLLRLLDERLLVRDVEHTSGIGEIIIFYNFYLFKQTYKFLFKN